MDNSHINRPIFPLKPLIILFLIVATYTVFSHVLDHDFIILDDNVYVTENPQVQAGLTSKGFLWAFTPFNDAGLWVPFTWLSLMVDSHLYGLNPGGYHLTNLLLHIINALLLFLVLERITGALWRSGFVAALFSLHPLRVESVAWITERKDVLSTLFLILTIWIYYRYAQKQTIKRYFLVLIFFVLGLMSKPMLVSLPFVLLLLDYWPFGRIGFVKSGSLQKGFFNTHIKSSRMLHLIFEKIPLFFLAAIMAVFTFLAQKTGGALAAFELIPFKVRIANAMVSYVKYIGKMIWPRHLAVFYPHPGTVPIWHMIGAILFLLAVSILVIWKAHRPYLLVGWFWYIGTLVPVIGLVQAGLQAMADRFTYVPLIGLFIIIAWGVPDMLLRLHYRRIILSISAGIVLCFLMICTWLQVRHWQNSFTLFEHTLDVTDNNWLIHNNLGYVLVGSGRPAEGILHYQEALRIRPVFAQAQFNLGNALVRSGRPAEGILHYQEALRIRPDYEEVHNNLGSALAQEGRPEEAISHYLEALRIKPDSARAHFNIGVALAGKGAFAQAIGHYKEALRIMPDHVKAHFFLGLAYVYTGGRRGALEEYKILKIIDKVFADMLFDKIYEVDLQR